MPRKPKRPADGSIVPRYIPQHRECIWEARPIPTGLIEPDPVSILAPLLYIAWSPKDGLFGVRQDDSGLAHCPAHFSPEQLRHIMTAAKLPGEYAMVLYVPKGVAGKPRPVEARPKKCRALPKPNPVCGRIHVGSDNGKK